ncbi:MAG TPA: UvrB/UvrC motif-containing protein [Ruminiclostridium sp.]
MLCQNCQQRAANVQFTQTKNNSKVDVYLCEQCAKEIRQTEFVSPLGFDDLINGLFGTQLKQEAPAALKCNNCGMEYAQFLRSSRLGCAKCYKAFGPKLDPVIIRLHGNAQHHGKVPGRVSSNINVPNEIEKLKQFLNESIQKEEYEEAAKIRDRIRSLEVGE